MSNQSSGIIEDDGKRFLLNTRWDQSLQNELKRRAQLLTVTMEAMNAFTWFFEPAKNRVSFGEGFDKNGKKASEINSVEKYLTLVHPDDRQKFAETLQKAVELGAVYGMWNIALTLKEMACINGGKRVALLKPQL